MERLTRRIKNGDFAMNIIDNQNDVMDNYIMACDRLADYEDTGLTPGQIMKLKERDMAKMCKQSIFDYDSITCICGADMDKDVEFMFCPWCGQRLKKWEK